MKKLIWYYPHLKFMMGGTKFILESAKRLKKHFDITLNCNLGEKEVISTFEEAGIKVKTISNISTNSALYWALFPYFLISDYFRVREMLREADVIIATLFPSNLVCALYGLFTGKKYYYYCYEPYPFFHSSEFKSSFNLVKRLFLGILSFFYGWLDIWATRKAEKILTLNETTKRLIRKAYSKNSIVTLMGVDTKHFRPRARNKIQKKFAGKIIVTHATDYTFMKRTDLALETISHLVKKHPSILLVITTTQPDSPQKKKYEDLVEKLQLKKQVYFAGLVPYSDLPLYYGASLCYLSCSYDETLGTTSSNMPVKEALACEIPALRANITTEDVEDGISGYLIDPRQTEEVAKKISFLINHPDKIKQMGKKGREKIVKHYQWEKVSERITRVLT